MTQAVMTKSSFVDDKAHNNEVLTEENKKNLFDITTGKALTDVKQKKIKVSAEERLIVSLLQDFYSKKFGREITFSQLVSILLSKELESQFSLDLSSIQTALSSLKINNLTLPKLTLPLGVSQDE